MVEDRKVAAISIRPEPMHSGRINPMIYGGFVELLDDLVPGMWAEMLNDRSFEGTGRTRNWMYYTGRPNFSDREWDANDTWERDSSAPFVGTCSAKLNPPANRPAKLSQRGIAAKKGTTYKFSGWFRAESTSAQVKVALKTLLPDETWTTLASSEFVVESDEWIKHTVAFVSNGTSEDVIFELDAAGGTIWADKLSLMPAKNLHGWRQDVVKAIKDQKPGMIRWGGLVVDPGDYKWKNGIGDRDHRAPFANWAWGINDSNDVGIDEFLQFCELVDVEPLVCVTTSEGSESAKELIEYCNGSAESTWGAERCKNGHPAPYNVRYWQVGNELKGKEYTNACTAFCKAIREAQPDALILSSYPTPELLEAVGDQLDYTCPHHYTPNMDENEKSISEIREMLKRYGLEGKMKVGVTEWNSTGGDPGVERGRLMSLWCGLFAGIYLNFVHRHSDIIDLACRSNITNSFCSGMIQTTLTEVLKTPGYHVLRLYAEHSKPVPLSTEGAPEGVDISACRSEGKRKTTLFAVNSNKEPVEVAIEGDSLAAMTGEVVCDTLDRRQVETLNHWEAPNRILVQPLDVSGNTIILPAYSVAAIEFDAR